MKIGTLAIFSVIFLISAVRAEAQTVLPYESSQTLICAAGASVELDSNSIRKVDSSYYRFFLSLRSNSTRIFEARKKYIGALSPLPEVTYECSRNQAGNIDICKSGSSVIIFSSTKMEGLHLDLSIMRVMKEGRFDAGSAHTIYCQSN